MIRSFGDRGTATLFDGRHVPGLPRDIQIRAYRKLRLVDAAASLDFLRVPPGNRLEKLSGNRAGQHSIRVNEQWRICFVWREGSAEDVELVDYH